MEANNFDDVRKHAIAAANIDSKNYDAKMLRGLASVCQKDFVASELFFDSALEQSPNNFIASNNLALSLIEQDDQAKFKRATDLAEANVNKFPDSSSAWSTYGWVLYKLGRLEEADKALKKAASKGPVSIDTAYYIARLKVDQDHKDEALKTLEEAFGRNQGISMYRDEATELLDSLKK